MTQRLDQAGSYHRICQKNLSILLHNSAKNYPSTERLDQARRVVKQQFYAFFPQVHSLFT